MAKRKWKHTHTHLAYRMLIDASTHTHAHSRPPHQEHRHEIRLSTCSRVPPTPPPHPSFVNQRHSNQTHHNTIFQLLLSRSCFPPVTTSVSSQHTLHLQYITTTATSLLLSSPHVTTTTSPRHNLIPLSFLIITSRRHPFDCHITTAITISH